MTAHVTPAWLVEQLAGAAVPFAPTHYPSDSDDHDLEESSHDAPSKVAPDYATSPEVCRRKPAGMRSLTSRSPTSVTMLTSETVRVETQTVRSSCQHADLVLERCARVHDELNHIISKRGFSSSEAMHLRFQLEATLEEIDGIEIDDVPVALGFADPSLMAVVGVTRANLEEASKRCCADIVQLDQAMEDESDWTSGLNSNDLDFLRQLEALQNICETASLSGKGVGQADVRDELPKDLALD